MKVNKYRIIIILIFSFFSICVVFKNTAINDSEEFKRKEKVMEDKIILNNIVENKADTSTVEIISSKPKSIVLDVPFVVQAPFGEWSDPRQQDGCEEMAAIMAMAWVKGEELSKEKARSELFLIADYEFKKYDNYIDTSASATVSIIFNGFYDYKKVDVRYNISKQDIINELLDGNLIIVPINGQKIGNPYYTSPGPERHILLIIGYDSEKNEFITNDQGTKRGAGYRYNENVLFSSIRDYPSGNHLEIKDNKKAIIIVKR